MKELQRVTVIGNGGMGTVCALILCSKGKEVTMWGHDSDELAEMECARENVRYLPGYKIPPSLTFEANDKKALANAELVVNAVPCQFVRSVFTRLRATVPHSIPIASVTKGFERETLLRPTQILSEILGQRDYVVLSGPTIADEIAQQLPATITAAAMSNEAAVMVQELFSCDYLRVYTNDDVIGVELAGAVKNVIAIAAGIVDGLGAGDNAKAALVTRGLAEIRRLGEAMGARVNTFAGLSGLGDLVTTCISSMGRNRGFGERIGKGMSAREALAATQSVVEGAATCRSVLVLAEKHEVDMPITAAVDAVISGEMTARQAIHDLMTRKLKQE